MEAQCLNDLEKDDNYALVEWTLTDSHNPRNWSRLKKAFVTFQFCLLTTSIYIEAGLPSIQTQFHLSPVKALLGLILFVIGYGLGLLVWIGAFSSLTNGCADSLIIFSFS